jgi:hypothetical protein
LANETTTASTDTTVATVPSGCILLGDGTIKCPDTAASEVCKPWKLQESRDACIQEDYANEALNIGGATANVFKLLGVHEQTKLVDQTGRGVAISGGDMGQFSAANAFTSECTVWRSKQRGANVVSKAYIGYDFGPIKITTGRQRHGDARPETQDV